MCPSERERGEVSLKVSLVYTRKVCPLLGMGHIYGTTYNEGKGGNQSENPLKFQRKGQKYLRNTSIATQGWRNISL